MRPLRRFEMGVSALLSVSCLVACGQDPRDDGPRVIQTPDAAVLVAAPADGGNDASIAGDVTIVDGCLGIGDNVALWPSGTRVIKSQGPVIDVPGLGTLNVGDAVEGAGGYMRAEDLNDSSSPTVPESCLESGLVVYRPE